MSQWNQEIISKDEAATAELAAEFSQGLKAGDVVLLYGDLGAGKSVFCRRLIRALCHDPELEVPSPTYTLVQTYPWREKGIWHFDLYRLSEPSEIYETGWEEALSGGIVLVEWPERLGALLPSRRIDVKIEPVSSQPNQRKISILRHGV